MRSRRASRVSRLVRTKSVPSMVSADTAQARQLRKPGSGRQPADPGSPESAGAGRSIGESIGTPDWNTFSCRQSPIFTRADKILFAARPGGNGAYFSSDAVLGATNRRQSPRLGRSPAVVDIRTKTLERLTDAHQNRQRLPLSDGTTWRKTQRSGVVHRPTQVEQGRPRVMTRAWRSAASFVIDQAGTVPREVREAAAKPSISPDAPARHVHLLTPMSESSMGGQNASRVAGPSSEAVSSARRCSAE